MRGKLEVEPCLDVQARIIPAHAGQTCCNGRPRDSDPDHPRTCGANDNWRISGLSPFGSSPHMRGKPAAFPRDAAPSECRRRARQKRSAPPGSSPHMRGKRDDINSVHEMLRIIPAHAGQTSLVLHIGSLSTDHPRTCGANSLIPLAKRTPTILEKFDLHSRSHFANVITIPNFLTSTRNPQFNIATTTIYQNDDIVMHCSNLFYEIRPEISRWIRPDHEAS